MMQLHAADLGQTQHAVAHAVQEEAGDGAVVQGRQIDAGERTGRKPSRCGREVKEAEERDPLFWLRGVPLGLIILPFLLGIGH